MSNFEPPTGPDGPPPGPGGTPGGPPPGGNQFGNPPGGFAGAPGTPPMGAANFPEASQSVIVLVMGILSLLLCQLLGPVAWIMGNKEIEGIDAGRRPPEQRNLANVGRILGIVATALFVLAILFFGCAVVISASSSS